MILEDMDLNNLPTEADLLDAIEPKSFHIAITGQVAIELVIEASVFCIPSSAQHSSNDASGGYAWRHTMT